jgi:hypothetical protein
MFDTSSISDVKVHGKSTREVIKAKTRLMQVGPVTYDLVQPVRRSHLQRVSTGEARVIYLIFTVGDLEETAGWPKSDRYLGKQSRHVFITPGKGWRRHDKLVQR